MASLLRLALLASSAVAGPLNPAFHDEDGFRHGGDRGIIRHYPYGYPSRLQSFNPTLSPSPPSIITPTPTPSLSPRTTTSSTSSSAISTFSSVSTSSNTSISTSSTQLPSSTASSPAPSLTQGPQATYHAYCGDGSVGDGWPSMDQWLEFDYLFEQNTPNMQLSCANWGVPNDSEEEIDNLKSSIYQVASLAGIDARFILAIVMQESTGCVRVITTNYAHPNPGLMQSYDGSGTCNLNQAPLGIGDTSASNVTTPCPESEIYQMVLDGTNGTASGPGLRQNFAEQNVTGAAGYYRTAKIYNGGINSLTNNENSLESGCCTTSYVSDVANRLMGWVNDAAREFTC